MHTMELGQYSEYLCICTLQEINNLLFTNPLLFISVGFALAYISSMKRHIHEATDLSGDT